MYIKRNAQGAVSQVSQELTRECTEYLASDAPELQLFFSAGEAESARLRQSDLDFVRVLEDVITLLMDKGVIRFTDLPEKAQEKLLDRQSLRKRVNDVDLMGNDDDNDVI